MKLRSVCGSQVALFNGGEGSDIKESGIALIHVIRGPSAALSIGGGEATMIPDA